jgi:CRP/FNR family transcriptional regulator
MRPTDRLRKARYFADLDEAALSEVARHLRIRKYESGQTIVAEAVPAEGLHLILEGAVRMTRSGPDGREQVLRVVGPGLTFNDAALFDDETLCDRAVAIGPTTVGVISKGAFQALLARYPAISGNALQLLARQQRVLGQVAGDLALRDVVGRVASLLLGCAGREGHLVEGAPLACTRITHEEIAAMTGSVREVVQRALKELERAGAIRLERARIRILDPELLEAWIDPDQRQPTGKTG